MAAKKTAPKAPAAPKCPMPYTGNSDANPKGKATPQGLKFVQIMGDRWGFTNLGIYSYRPMRSSTNPDGSPRLSVHSTGRAVDLGYKPSFQPRVSEICDWLADNYLELMIEEIHQYSWEGSEWGRGFRCCRDGAPGWKTWTADANGGTPGGKWIHVELSPDQTDTGLVRAWKNIVTKPQK